MSRAERRVMVRRPHPGLSLSRQCRLLSIGRSWLYYTPKGESAESLALMRRIDELFLKHPPQGADDEPSDGRRRTGAHRPSPGQSSDAPDGGFRRSTGRHAPAIRIPSSGSTPICSRACRSTDPIRSGAPTSPTSRCAAASFTWSPHRAPRRKSPPRRGCSELTDGFEARRLIDEWIDNRQASTCRLAQSMIATASTTPKGHTRRSMGKPRPRPTAATRLWV